MGFKAKIYPEAGPKSQPLIDAYNLAHGSAMNPCNPGGLAAALNELLNTYGEDPRNMVYALEGIIEELG